MPRLTLVAFTQTPPVLGVGAYYKNTLCLIQNGEAIISEPAVALDNADGLAIFEQSAKDLLAQLQRPLARVACDLHPDFYSTRYAESLSTPLHPVQHHHAHIAAIMAEQGISGPVLGLACDGFGLGDDGTSWGGELLHISAKGSRRLGRLRPIPQPGGDAAARAPWRMAAGALHLMGRASEITSRFAAFPGADILPVLLSRGTNCPPTSSMGRLFDTACGLLNIVPVASFEGEAPMALEKLVRSPQVMTGWNLTPQSNLLEFDFTPLLAALTTCDPQTGAELFHGTLAAGCADWITQAAEAEGLNTVVLSGGCFLNKVLREELALNLKKRSINTVVAQQISPGDATISLGQATAAAWALEEGI